MSGASGALSSTGVADPEAPYMLHDDANTNRSTPAAPRELGEPDGAPRG